MEKIVNEEAERGVLGSILVGSFSTGKVMPVDVCLDAGCTGDWFTLTSHRLTWEAMVALHAEGAPVDSISVGEKTKGFELINNLIDSCPSATSLPYYLSLAEDTSKRRRMASLGLDAQEMAQDAGSDVSLSVAVLSEGLTEINCKREVVSIEDIMQDNLKVLDNAFNGIVSGLPLPWTKFSDNVSGLQRASVIPFVGRDGKGKSGALCQMLDFWAGEGIPAISFSMEDVARRTVLRMAGCRKWFSARSVESGKTLDMNGKFQVMVRAEKDKLERQLESYGEWLQKRPFWIDDNKYTVEELCAKIRHYHRVHGIQVATIDGFKDIVHSKGDNDTACEKHIAQELFKVAKDLNIAIPVVSHITKIDDGIPIRKENIKGSGTQFQGARQVFIFQDAGIPEIIDEHHFILACTKNNYGSGGSAVLRRDPNVLKYQEL